MKNIVLVFSSKVFSPNDNWENYQKQVSAQLTVEPQLEVEPAFYHNKHQNKKELASKLLNWPKVIIFDECQHATIKKIHNKLSRENKETIFLAKTFGVKDHGINGVKTINKIGEVPFHLTALDNN